MKLIKGLLVLTGFCFLSNGYAMEKKEQIAQDLLTAQSLLSTAEKSVEIIDNFIRQNTECVCSTVKLKPEDEMRVYKERQDVTRLANQAYALSKNIVNDGSVSPRTQQDAQASRHRADVILQKYGIKK